MPESNCWQEEHFSEQNREEPPCEDNLDGIRNPGFAEYLASKRRGRDSAEGELQFTSTESPESSGTGVVTIAGQEIGPDRYVELGARADIRIQANPNNPTALRDRHVAIRTDSQGNVQILVLASGTRADIEFQAGTHRTITTSDGWVSLSPGDRLAFGGLQHMELANANSPRTRIAGLNIPADGSLIVGREPGENGHTINNRVVSRQHAMFEQTPQGFRVADLGSLNGTYIVRRGEANPIRVAPTPAGQEPRMVQLQAGDTVYLGRPGGTGVESFEVTATPLPEPGLSRARVQGLTIQQLSTARPTITEGPLRLPRVEPGHQVRVGETNLTVRGYATDGAGTERMIVQTRVPNSGDAVIINRRRLDVRQDGTVNPQRWQALPQLTQNGLEYYLDRADNRTVIEVRADNRAVGAVVDHLQAMNATEVARLNEASRRQFERPAAARIQDQFRVGQLVGRVDGEVRVLRTGGRDYAEALIQRTAPGAGPPEAPVRMRIERGDLLPSGQMNPERYEPLSGIAADPNHPDAMFYRDRRPSQADRVYMVYTDAQGQLQRIQRRDLQVVAQDALAAQQRDAILRRPASPRPAFDQREPLADREVINRFAESGLRQTAQLREQLNALPANERAARASQEFNRFIQGQLRQLELSTAQTARLHFQFSEQPGSSISYFYRTPGEGGTERAVDIQIVGGSAQFVDVETNRVIPNEQVHRRVTLPLQTLMDNPAQVLHDAYVELGEARGRTFVNNNLFHATIGENFARDRELSARFGDALPAGHRVRQIGAIEPPAAAQAPGGAAEQAVAAPEIRPRLRTPGSGADAPVEFAGDQVARAARDAQPLNPTQLRERLRQELERAQRDNNQNERRFYEELSRQLDNGTAEQQRQAAACLQDMFGRQNYEFSAETNQLLARRFTEEAQRALHEGRPRDAEFLRELGRGFGSELPAERRGARAFLSDLCGSRQRAIATGAGVLMLTAAGVGLYQYYRYRNAANQHNSTPATISGPRR